MEKLEREVLLRGAYDRRDPDPKKNYGIHGMDLLFILKGSKGAVQFLVFTPMHLPHVSAELLRNHSGGSSYNPFEPMGADIGYHSHKPHYEGQTICQEKCDIIGGPCYYDGTSLGASEFMPIFLAGGSEAVWKMLEERYKQTFEDEAND